jgi:hypothetical protein
MFIDSPNAYVGRGTTAAQAWTEIGTTHAVGICSSPGVYRLAN